MNASGEQSRQQDIIIVDSTSAPPLRASDDSEIYPIEAVAGVIEVKSRLDPGEVAGAVDAVAIVKRLVSDEQRDEVVHAHQASGHRFDDIFQTPFGGVFAYSSSANMESIADAFVEANDELPIHERANALIVLSGFVMMWAVELSGDGPPEARAVWFSCASKDAIPFWITTEANDLAIFYWILWDAVQNYDLPAFSALNYLQNLEFEGRFWEN